MPVPTGGWIALNKDTLHVPPDLSEANRIVSLNKKQGLFDFAKNNFLMIFGLRERSHDNPTYRFFIRRPEEESSDPIGIKYRRY